MRIIPFLICSLLTIVFILILNSTWLLPVPLGRLLSPQHGIWQNAEPIDENFNASFTFPGLKGNTEVYFDDRLVPHIFSENDEDAFFVQGFLHAKFRLWQMEFQTHAAAGRLTEVFGDQLNSIDILNRSDRYFRRLGMVYAAEISLQVMEQDALTKLVCDAYTSGVNEYIKTLTEATMPLEYKLLGYRPEPWSNLKTAIFMKSMAFELAGGENDFEYTAARDALTKAVFTKMYPLAQDSADPIVPRGTLFEKAAHLPVMPVKADSVYFKYKQADSTLPVVPLKPAAENGSNNWAVSGSKTKSGYPILANDPHLGLNLPSLWYEVQIQSPGFNVYGASFLCAPHVAIGFNDSCAFGFTNGGRDVRDYYTIRFRDSTKRQYWFDGKWKDTRFRIERYNIKNKAPFFDTVAYTIFGPVIFDDTYAGYKKKVRQPGGKWENVQCYAVRWKAHDPSNELKLFYTLNQAKNYRDYAEAIKHLHTPGQNCVFAAKNGDIAIWAQGEFPAKWRRQGDFIMPGTDSSYMWQGMIPQAENPHMVNPERNYVSSANQVPVDITYPYYLGSSFPPYRGSYINRQLSEMQNITPQDMMKLQTNNYNILAETALPLLLKAVDENKLSAEARKYWDILKNWNLYNDPREQGPTVFAVVFDSLEAVIWKDELAPVENHMMPHESTLLEGLLRDSAYIFLDNINTPGKRESLADDVLIAVQRALPELSKAAAENRLEWSKYKDTRINHLTRVPALSRLHLNVGGGTHSVNAIKSDHGPSWRMIVHLSPETEAYGIYPGGQNGNPGSKYYDNFVDDWMAGKYYRLKMMKKEDGNSTLVKWKMKFSKS